MRIFLILAGTWIAIVAVLVLAWNHRYEPMPGSEPLTLKELKPLIPNIKGVSWQGTEGEPVLRLSKEKGDSNVSLRIPISCPDACRAVHLRYHLQAKHLVPGERNWDDGRFNVAWNTPSHEQIQQVASVRDEMSVGCESIISLAPANGAEPQLLIAHLGVSGDYEISGVELVAVRDKPWWGMAAWGLIIAGMAWVIAVLFAISHVSRLRTIMAAIITFVVVLEIIVPGPWILRKPLIRQQFEVVVSHDAALESESQPMDNALPAPEGVIVEQQVESPTPANQVPQDLPQAVKTDDVKQEDLKLSQRQPAAIQGNALLDIKEFFKSMKGVLHALFFGGLALCLTLLIRARPAILVCVFISLGTELAQLAFGYGFDATDVVDLLMDGVGIAVGVGVAAAVAAVKSRKSKSRSADALRAMADKRSG